MLNSAFADPSPTFAGQQTSTQSVMSDSPPPPPPPPPPCPSSPLSSYRICPLTVPGTPQARLLSAPSLFRYTPWFPVHSPPLDCEIINMNRASGGQGMSFHDVPDADDIESLPELSPEQVWNHTSPLSACSAPLPTTAAPTLARPVPLQPAPSLSTFAVDGSALLVGHSPAGSSPAAGEGREECVFHWQRRHRCEDLPCTPPCPLLRLQCVACPHLSLFPHRDNICLRRCMIASSACPLQANHISSTVSSVGFATSTGWLFHPEWQSPRPRALLRHT